MSHTSGSGRPSRNSQGISNTALQPTMFTTPVPETPVNSATAPHTPVKIPLARSTPLPRKQFCSYGHLKYQHTNAHANHHTGQTTSGRSTHSMH